MKDPHWLRAQVDPAWRTLRVRWGRRRTAPVATNGVENEAGAWRGPS